MTYQDVWIERQETELGTFWEKVCENHRILYFYDTIWSADRYLNVHNGSLPTALFTCVLLFYCLFVCFLMSPILMLHELCMYTAQRRLFILKTKRDSLKNVLWLSNIMTTNPEHMYMYVCGGRSVRRWWCVIFIRFEIIAKRGIIARLSNKTSFRLYDKVRKGRFFNIFNLLAATQNVACYRFLHILMESERNYFHQNHGEKWPATMVNKQVFFAQKFGFNNLFTYNTAEVRHINPKLSGNKRQGDLSWQLQRKQFNEGWSVNYGASTIITPSVSPWSGLIRGHNYKTR